MKTFTISHNGEAITCLRCNTTSYSHLDVLYHYCPKCHHLHSDVRCDFCMLDDVDLAQTYYANRSIEGTLPTSQGEMEVDDNRQWGACADCAALINSHCWGALLARAVDGILRTSPEVPDTPMSRLAFKVQTIQVYREAFGWSIGL